MNFLENITLRRTGRTRTKSDSQSNLSQHDNELLTQIMDDTATSVPDMSKDDSYDQELITNLKKQVEKLTLQLSSAEEEIDNLTLENNNLKQSNEELQKINILYKKITNSPAKKSKKKIDETSQSKQTQTKQLKITEKKTFKNKGTQTVVKTHATQEKTVKEVEHVSL
ncbi:unnamed protein product [Parnassius mnemosyne]|uniref:Uncharacterized protein n=1 Tax=Parnassius mnemosyne TaxID=213953 RepID=A0AAV1LN42_9NEOP